MVFYTFSMIIIFFFFFFSSRRRHTRLQGDWSSDVCSSDLVARVVLDLIGAGTPRRQRCVQRILAARREFGFDVQQVRAGRGDRDLVFHGLRRQRDGDEEADQPAHRVTPRGWGVLCTPLKTKRPRRLVRAAWSARRARQELTFSLASATMARNSLLGLKTGTGRAATSTGSPVRG